MYLCVLLSVYSLVILFVWSVRFSRYHHDRRRLEGREFFNQCIYFLSVVEIVLDLVEGRQTREPNVNQQATFV